MPRPRRRLPPALLDALSTADIIVHLGDFTQIEVVSLLRSFGPLVGVHGNNDSEEVRRLFPAFNQFEIGRFTVSLLHGHLNGRTARDAASKVRDSDVILFGHSHAPYHQIEQGRLFFNPGSPTDRRWSATCAFGIVTIGKQVAAELVPVH